MCGSSRKFARVALAAALAGGLISAAQDPAAEFQNWLRTGNVAAIGAALDKDPGRVGRPDGRGVPPLLWAAYFGQLPAVDLLLARGADPNASSPFGTPLLAAVMGGHPDVVLALAAKGADLDRGGEAREAPLLAAVRYGQAPSAEALIERGASVDVRDAGGNSVLLLAASYGHAPVVRALLERHADTSVTNRYGNTALDVAEREGQTAVINLLRASDAPAKPAPALKGAYLGQIPPTVAPKLFAPGFVSTERRELNAAFTPDGRTLFFSRDRGPRGTRILMTSVANGGWQPPVPAPFSRGDTTDVDMFVTVDGSEVYFCSDRPLPNQPSRKKTPGDEGSAESAVDIWVARTQGSGWGPATWLGPEVNAPDAADYYPTLTRSGTLYFSSNRAGGLGENDVYRARRVNGRWMKPENLGPPINTAGREFDPFVAPDESYLIFASERPGGLGGADLYVSPRRLDGSWGTPINLGPGVNSPAGDYTPMLSPDGRYLFFTSGGAGSDDIHWVDAGVIRKAIAGNAGAQVGRPRLQGPYLGQAPPGLKPEIFAPGVVSTDAHEFSCSFTPDGMEFYFTRRASPQSPTLIMVSRSVYGTWTDPEPAPFNDPSAQMSFEPLVTPDGRRLYFSSDRPLPGQAGGSGLPALNIWYVERQGDRWSEPRSAGPPLNPMQAMYVSMTRTGTIYTMDISGGMGSESIAATRLIDGSYGKLEKLGPPVNVGTGNMYPFIAPDESYLIFTRRIAQPAVTELCVSFRKPDGTWGDPHAIDLGMPAGTASVSPDGRYLFFSGGERGKGDIYWVSAGVLKKPGPP